jgi:hypothetical protein
LEEAEMKEKADEEPQKNPIVETLWCCEYWNPSSQECYCIKEAIKSKTNK